MLVSQLSAMQPDDLLVLDRGYPAHWLFALLLQQQRAFCIRLKLDYSSQVAAFVRSGLDSRVITCQPTRHHAGFAEHDLPLTPFPLRLVRVVLPSGQIEVLVTSLLDEEQYPASVFGQLYRQRWRIEEAFRHIKCRLKLERFGGETPLAIRQEFHATILLHNLATLAGLDTLQALPEAERSEQHVNLTHASRLLRLLIPQLLQPGGDIDVLCAGLLEGVLCQLTRTRPGRIGPPRKRNRAKPRYHPGCLCGWRPSPQVIDDFHGHQSGEDPLDDRGRCLQ